MQDVEKGEVEEIYIYICGNTSSSAASPPQKKKKKVNSFWGEKRLKRL